MVYTHQLTQNYMYTFKIPIFFLASFHSQFGNPSYVIFCSCIFETKNYLKAKKDEVEKVIEDIQELLNPTVEKVEKKEEPKVDPTDWMFTFLKDNEMGDFYDKFEEANILGIH